MASTPMVDAADRVEEMITNRCINRWFMDGQTIHQIHCRLYLTVRPRYWVRYVEEAIRKVANRRRR